MTADDTPPPESHSAPSLDSLPATPAPRPTPPGKPGGQRAFIGSLAIILAIGALFVAAWQWRENRLQLDALRAEVATRLAQSDADGKKARDEAEALQARLTVVETRLTEFTGQTEALQSLYENLARGREEAVLLEVEQALTLAEQQLQLAGNVAVAALALQTADARLARLDPSRFQPLRDALATDLNRLKAESSHDLAGIGQRLEEIIARVDALPLRALDRPANAAESASSQTEAGAAWWRLVVADAWRALRGLVRIQRIDRDEPALLAPEQNFFLRENLKLRLLNARLSLLARDHASFRAELAVAQDWLQRYFTPGDPAVKEAQNSLQQWLAADPAADPPGLGGSLTALARLRGPKESR